MPSWIKKRIQVLKNDFINHLIVVKNQQQMVHTPASTMAICDNRNNRNNNIANNNNHICDERNDKKTVRIRRIQNDLHTNRFTAKTDMNAYNDYTKWRDQVLINQNDCALRCIKQEEKINNTDKIDSHIVCANGAINRNGTRDNGRSCTFESRQTRCDNQANNENDSRASASNDGDDDCDVDGISDARYASESEFVWPINCFNCAFNCENIWLCLFSLFLFLFAHRHPFKCIHRNEFTSFW